MALFTFLGLWFDGLTWRVHIEAVVARCKRVLNVMRCLVGLDWGTDRRSLRMIFVGLIRFAIDYGCVAYRLACKTLLGKLDVVQAQALRIVSGAFRSTSVLALQVLTGEMPLGLRRRQLMVAY